MPSKTLSVAAIKNGTVIDHIPQGTALRILALLNLTSYPKIATVGLNLPSQSMKRKDLIKLEDREITQEEASQIAVFAPKATMAIIRNYAVIKKIPLRIPDTVEHVFLCHNQNCVTNKDRMSSKFRIIQTGSSIHLECVYCERMYSQDQMKNYIHDV
ncbi:aspartate carbamoyltransferase regulatory subunit [Candidatus Uhrbacteria bacterium]|nr:aspartate carbamoyltransferase regulatory subunit [Candidatus Uhrbacteria bacterium]